MIFLSFDQWVDVEMNHLSETNPIIDCPTCNGEGVVEDDCDCCGHESNEMCDDCLGGGEAEFNDISEYGQRTYLNKEKYLSSIKKDFLLWASFTGENEAELYFNNGFIAWCQVKTKEIFIAQ